MKKLNRQKVLHIAKSNGGRFYVHRYKWSAERVRKMMGKWVRESDCPFHAGPDIQNKLFVYRLKKEKKDE